MNYSRNLSKFVGRGAQIQRYGPRRRHPRNPSRITSATSWPSTRANRSASTSGRRRRKARNGPRPSPTTVGTLCCASKARSNLGSTRPGRPGEIEEVRQGAARVLRAGSALLCMGLFSRFFVQALPCTAEGTLCRVRDTRSLVPRAYGTNRSNSNTSCSRVACLPCPRPASPASATGRYRSSRRRRRRSCARDR